VFFGQYTIKGTTMGNDQEFADMLAFIEKHQIHPIIDSVRPFEQIIEAFNDMRDGKIFGKVVIEM
jgi:zinc-binding alcohol dehydrogenase/oxidoreductase